MNPDYVFCSMRTGTVYLLDAVGEMTAEKIIEAAFSAVHPSQFSLDCYVVANVTDGGTLYMRVA